MFLRPAAGLAARHDATMRDYIPVLYTILYYTLYMYCGWRGTAELWMTYAVRLMRSNSNARNAIPSQSRSF